MYQWKSIKRWNWWSRTELTEQAFNHSLISSSLSSSLFHITLLSSSCPSPGCLHCFVAPSFHPSSPLFLPFFLSCSLFCCLYPSIKDRELYKFLFPSLLLPSLLFSPLLQLLLLFTSFTIRPGPILPLLVSFCFHSFSITPSPPQSVGSVHFFHLVLFSCQIRSVGPPGLLYSPEPLNSVYDIGVVHWASPGEAEETRGEIKPKQACEEHMHWRSTEGAEQNPYRPAANSCNESGEAPKGSFVVFYLKLTAPWCDLFSVVHTQLNMALRTPVWTSLLTLK